MEPGTVSSTSVPVVLIVSSGLNQGCSSESQVLPLHAYHYILSWIAIKDMTTSGDPAMPHMVVEILKVGLSGFVFLLSWMAYRLLRAEQSAKARDANMIHAINRYMWQSFFCAILVGGFSLADHFLGQQQKAQQSLVNSCADSLNRLDTYMQLPNISERDFRAAVSKNVSSCSSLTEKLDEH